MSFYITSGTKQEGKYYDSKIVTVMIFYFMVLLKSTYLLQTGDFGYIPKHQSTRISATARNDTAANQPIQGSSWWDGREFPTCYDGKACQLLGSI